MPRLRRLPSGNILNPALYDINNDGRVTRSEKHRVDAELAAVEAEAAAAAAAAAGFNLSERMAPPRGVGGKLEACPVPDAASC
mmetsp:Transcript_48883/g.106282  ORF Transcript_48883/g.106282 Transcript_48883/m.106282 type:complete len:83 (+) Transcript_48883:47-295(+)